MYISLSIPFQYQPLQYKITEIKRKARVWGLDWTLILVKSSSCPWSAWVEHPHKSQNVSAFAMDRYGSLCIEFIWFRCTMLHAEPQSRLSSFKRSSTSSLTASHDHKTVSLLVKNGPKQIADSSRWIFAGASIAMRQIATSYSLCTKSKAQWYFVVLLKHIARLLCSPAVRINNRLCDRMLLSSHCLGKLLVSHTAFGCGSHLRQSGCTVCYGDRARWKPKAKISKEEIHEEKYPHRIIIVSSYESYCSIIQNGRRSCWHG